MDGLQVIRALVCSHKVKSQGKQTASVCRKQGPYMNLKYLNTSPAFINTGVRKGVLPILGLWMETEDKILD